MEAIVERVLAAGGTLPALPVELIDIKLKLQSLDLRSELIVENDVSIYEQATKTSRLIFRPHSRLVFETLSHPWLVLYADVIDFLRSRRNLSNGQSQR
jgi:hypothetical protein